MLRLFTFFSFIFISLTVNGQCLDEDVHNTSLDGVWMSCQKSANPLQGFGDSHWILYEFDNIQPIENLQIWNINHPDKRTSGAKRVRMDISSDGAAWTNHSLLNLEMADASYDYSGERIEDIASFEAKFVLFTILENHGGTCSGLGEVKFNLGAVTVATEEEYLSSLVSISPNPASSSVQISLADINTSSVSYQVVDVAGRILMRKKDQRIGSNKEFSIATSALADGHYTLSMVTDEGLIAKQIIVAQPR